MKYFIILFSCLILSSCITNKSDQTPTVKPYIGTWDITFTGSASGSGNITIVNEGLFSNTVTVGGNNYVASGNVDNNGTINGGKLGNGSFTGNFGGNAGNGNWSVQGNSGTWTAVKR